MTSCPNCGSDETPAIAKQHVRDYLDRPHTIIFYNCACGFSTWDYDAFRPATTTEATSG